MIDLNLKMRIAAVFVAIICFVVSYTMMADLRPKLMFIKMVNRIIWASLYVVGLGCFFYAITVGVIS